MFTGKIGDRVRVYKKAHKTYKKLIKAYNAKMRAHSIAHTDWVGVKATGICKP